MKVERFSYPFITPSAARGIFDTIYWKSGYDFYWQIDKIEILNPLKHISIKRNEVKDTVPSLRILKQWMSGKKPVEPIIVDGNFSPVKGRTQRQTIALKDVRYRITAHMETRDPLDGLVNHRAKSLDPQFERRARRGQCVRQPCLGFREFGAFFKLIEGEPEGTPVDFNEDIGLMLYDVFDLSTRNGPGAAAKISFFYPQIKHGILEVPRYTSPLVFKP